MRGGGWLRVAIGLVCAVSARAAAQETPPPNIVVIMADDMGYSDIGCYGGEIDTPRLDALAAGGLRFTQFYNTGRCCPTRASLLTGRYPHEAGVGHMTSQLRDAEGHALPAYAGDLNDRCVTIAEVLRDAGYATYMAGKWHVTRHLGPGGATHNWPLQRGFDRYYGIIAGGGNMWDPYTLNRGDERVSPFADPRYAPERPYHVTDAFADHAIRFVTEHDAARGDQPFFLYLAFTAPHWPMHAHAEDVARYAGRFDAGYDTLRRERFERMRGMGLIDESVGLSETFGDWDAPWLDEHRAWELRCMEVYAAMVTQLDRKVGELVDALAAQRQLDDTLIVFLSDNGGCQEAMGRHTRGDWGNPERWLAAGGAAMDPATPQPALWPPMRQRGGGPVLGGVETMPGGPGSYIAYGQAWANVSNTPFRFYKHLVHEGGISTPLIVHWPAGIDASRRGSLVHEPGHVIDLMATAVDLAGALVPEGRLPPRGVSLVPAMRGEELGRSEPIFWEHQGNRAIRDGRYKAVARGVNGRWELYDLAVDRSELNDLADDRPALVAGLAARWEAWALETGVKPYPDAGPWR